MKFTYCLIVTFVGFAVVYFASLDYRRVSQFDGNPPTVASDPTPEIRPREIKIVHRPQNKLAARPSEEAPLRAKTEPISNRQPAPEITAPKPREGQSPDTDGPSQTASISSTPRDGTQGSAAINLEVLIRGVKDDKELERLLLLEGCKIVVVKVEEEKVVEAFLPDRQNNLVWTSGDQGTTQFESFRRLSCPTNRFLWVRWHDSEHGIGAMARANLRRFGVNPEGYFIYLVLGRELSADVQRLLTHKASEQGVAIQDVGYVQVALHSDRSRFRAEVLHVRPRPDLNDADQAEPQRRDETTEVRSTL